jgi:hypothetical protein
MAPIVTAPLLSRSTSDFTEDMHSSLKTLAQYCDLWDTTNQLFTQSKNFAAHFIRTEGLQLCQQILEIALNSLIHCESQDFSLTLLFSRDRSTELGCWLALVQATLSLALNSASSMSTHDFHEVSVLSLHPYFAKLLLFSLGRRCTSPGYSEHGVAASGIERPRPWPSESCHVEACV